jgi:hypothetical protein
MSRVPHHAEAGHPRAAASCLPLAVIRLGDPPVTRAEASARTSTTLSNGTGSGSGERSGLAARYRTRWNVARTRGELSPEFAAGIDASGKTSPAASRPSVGCASATSFAALGNISVCLWLALKPGGNFLWVRHRVAVRSSGNPIFICGGHRLFDLVSNWQARWRPSSRPDCHQGRRSDEF